MDDRPKHVLVADDDLFLRRAVEAVLTRRGYTVVTTADGEEAVRLAKESVPDLILLDLVMPKLQGSDTLKRLKADPATARVPVIVLSALSEKSHVTDALEAGAASYLVKTGSLLERVVTEVAKILDARTP